MQPVSTKESSTWFYDLPAIRSSYVQSTRYSWDSTAVFTLNSYRKGKKLRLMSEIVPGNCLFVNSDLAVTKELWDAIVRWADAGGNFSHSFLGSPVNAPELCI